jgi:enoyl-CoA hydratase/carnithine racemase
MSDATATTTSTRYELRDRTAWIHLTRPDKRNALNPDVLAGIATGLDRATDDDARVVVLAGSGTAFCAGADLSHVRGSLDDLTAIEDLMATAGRLTLRMEAFPSPIIASVNGAAVAGGLELVLACDLVVAAESATFSDGHAAFGLFPGAGASVRLPRLIGANRARGLMYTATTLDARTMHALGVVNDVVPDDELAAAVDRLASRVAHGSRDAVARMKRAIQVGMNLPTEEALAFELAQAREHLHSADVAEGLSAFAEHRRPSFR